MTTDLEVVEMATGNVVKTLDVRGRSEREIEKILAGMLRNLNTERFCIREKGVVEKVN